MILNGSKWWSTLAKPRAHLTFLKSLPNLKALGIWGFQNPDLSPIKELTQLNKLFLGYDLLQTIPDLSTLTSLQELDLRFNSITDLTPISKLKNITSSDIVCLLLDFES